MYKVKNSSLTNRSQMEDCKQSDCKKESGIKGMQCFFQTASIWVHIESYQPNPAE